MNRGYRAPNRPFLIYSGQLVDKSSNNEVSNVQLSVVL